MYYDRQGIPPSQNGPHSGFSLLDIFIDQLGEVPPRIS